MNPPPTPDIPLPATPQQIHRLKAVLSYLEAIPEERWCKGTFHRTNPDRRCVWGHLLQKESPLDAPGVMAFCAWFARKHGEVIMGVNDQAPGSPREAVLTALRGVYAKITAQAP